MPLREAPPTIFVCGDSSFVLPVFFSPAHYHETSDGLPLSSPVPYFTTGSFWAKLKNLIAQVLFYRGFINLSLNYSCELLNFGLKIIIQRTTRTRNVLSAASKAWTYTSWALKEACFSSSEAMTTWEEASTELSSIPDIYATHPKGLTSVSCSHLSKIFLLFC